MSGSKSGVSGTDEAMKSRWPVAEGELARLMRELDWSSTPLGPTETWSQALRTTVDLMLGAQAEIVLFCGPEYVALYNDAYVPTIGDKHPRALGRPARENWAELWDDLEPLLRGVMETGKTYAAKDRPFYLERSEAGGETVYFDISYSAVRGCDGSVEAVLCIVTETTLRVRAMQSQQKIRESEALHRALFESIDEGACIFERVVSGPGGLRDYRYIAMNPAMQAMFGVPDLSGRTIREVFPDEVEDWYDDYDRVLETGESIRFQRESVPQGKVLEMFVSPLKEQSGQVLAVIQDITKRKQAEEQERLLHTELSHRMKNLFAMVQAISAQTLRRVGDRAQVQALQDRLKALSGAHDILLHNSWSDAPIEEVVEVAASSLAAADRIRQDGPSFRLGPRAALSMALLLHELGTNALKHGALSVPEGRVDLTWRVEAGDGVPVIHMHWAESGGPDVTEPEAHGFGSKLIQAGLGGSGSVTVRFARSGLEAEISAPLHELLSID